LHGSEGARRCDEQELSVSESCRFENLLAPGRIGSLALRNRLIMSPMGSNLAQEDGHLGERIKRYYEERARGGVGLIIVGVGAISFPAGACNPNQVAISDDAFLPGLTDLSQRVHAHGAKLAIQLQHAGKVAVRDMAAGRPMWVPSELPYKRGDLTDDLTPEELQAFVKSFTGEGAGMFYREMSSADIAKITADFADAADRARRAGFDAVELHAGHGYLLSSFLSPASNKREDDYGGSVENRSRFLVEVIRAVKQRVGADFPVWCRIDAKEFRIEGGISEPDARRTAELAEAAGADAIHVSAYADSSSGVAFTDAPLVHQPRGYVRLAEGIKKRVGIPVIAVGRIEPEEADAIVAAGQADFIAMARKLLADPELPRKLAEGRPQDVRPCIYCYTCVGNIFLNRATCCAVNPATGLEAEFEIEPAARPRRVLVAGGGPAGMEAARVAALRGHRVTLCEKRDRLGGTLLFSSLVYEANGRLAEWLEAQVRGLPIELQLGREVTPELVKELAPDVVLVAVGARREPPAIPGVDRSNVLGGDDLRSLMTGDDGSAAARKLSLGQRAVLGVGSLLGVSERIGLARELTRRWMPLGKRVAVVGGGLVGIELAEFLVERGREVTVLEESKSFAAEMSPPRRWRALHGLREHGVRLLSQVQVQGIEDRGVVFSSGEGENRVLEIDSVILATGVLENTQLAEALAALGGEVRQLGDCSGVGYIQGAMLDAARAARAI
jgi:2,4-dienoyl-CoA reductase-like NADH-dependent reductase (Old Yellow Enzyme family)